MSFMGQFRLSELPRLDENLTLPDGGYLYFFFDTQDLAGSQVIWEPNESGLVEIAAPSPPAPEPPKGLKRLFGMKSNAPKFEVFKELNVDFRVVETYPPTDSDLLQPYEDDDLDELLDLRESIYGRLPAHHFFGYPDPEQGSEMEIDCELETNTSQVKRSSAYSDPAILKAAKDWRLLLQLDEDGATGFTFVDAGKLYFWIRTQDAVSNNFSRAHAICQFG